MISGQVTGFDKLDALSLRVKSISLGWSSPGGQRLASEVVAIIVDGNREAALRGLDRNGVPLVPVKNPDDPRRGGGGPPLSPSYDASRRAADFVTETTVSRSQLIIKCGWRGDIARILGYHKRGTRNLPVRDVVGIAPADKSRIRQKLQRFGTYAIGKAID
jgi:hypothetical protein